MTVFLANPSVAAALGGILHHSCSSPRFPASDNQQKSDTPFRGKMKVPCAFLNLTPL